MHRDQTTTWVVSRNLKPLGIFSSEEILGRWMDERGYQCADPAQPGYVLVSVAFGDAIG